MSEPIKKSRWSWGKTALTVSLAINLLFVGAVVGAGWMRKKHGGRHMGPPDFVVKRMLRELPEAKQNAILVLMKREQEGRRAKKGELRVHKRSLREALKAEPFDSAKVRAAAGEIGKIRGQMANSFTDLLIDSLQQLTPEERQTILKSRFFRRMLRSKDRSWRRRSSLPSILR